MGGFGPMGSGWGSVFWLIIWRHHPINAPILWLAVFMDSRLKYAFYEPLIKFLAFLVQKLCQKYSKYVRNFQGPSGDLIFYHFFHNSSTRNAKKSIKPSKTSFYSLECINLARFRAADSARFTHSHGPLTSRIFYRNLSKHFKTTCGFANTVRKAEIARRKVFFQHKLQVFPHSERIWTAL